MESLLSDLRYCVRLFARSPLFTGVAVLTLALGIGANTAIFSLVYALLLRPLPGVEEPERLVSLFTSDFSSSPYGANSYSDYIDYRDRNETFENLAAYRESDLILATHETPQRVRGAAVTGNYFSVLRPRTAFGRPLLPDDDITSASPVVVISYKAWQRRFDADPQLIGRTVELNNNIFTVVGVADERFRGSNLAAEVELWFPMQMLERIQPGSSQLFARRGARWLRIIGRIKDRVTVQQAKANIEAISYQLADAYPASNRGTLQQPDKPRPVTLSSSSEMATFNPTTRTTVIKLSRLLMAVVGFVLLIACANVANLLLARAESRRKEIAVRLALGAPRARLIRQMLTESLVLSVAGGAAGLLISVWLMDLVSLFDLPPAIDTSLDKTVVGFALAISFSTGIMFGLVPALQASKVDLIPALKDSTRHSKISTRRFSTRDLLVVSQVALSLVLLIGSALFLKSLQNAYHADLGFETRDALLASVDLSLQRYDTSAQKEFETQIRTRLAALPGVMSVATTAFMPLTTSGMRGAVRVEGHQVREGEDTEIDMNAVSIGYFDTMGISLLAGRDFTDRDKQDAPPVAVINDAMASRYWPDQDAIGKRISLSGSQGPMVEIVGVVKTGTYRALGEPGIAYIYLPEAQNPVGRFTIIARTSGNAAALADPLRRQVRELDKALALFDVRTLNEHIDEALSQQRMIATLLGAFGVLALLLASVGIYGVMSYSVTRRTRELGVRIALGAGPVDILKLVVGRGLLLTLSGASLGLLAALSLTHVVDGLLFGVKPTDPVVFVAITALLTGVALVASFVPARRASKVDPMTAVRYE
jgi:macrolide transport system ATP-binding/permease protein